jgi:hypothetical protein
MQRTNKEKLLKFMNCLMNHSPEVFPEERRAEDLETVWMVILTTAANPGEQIAAPQSALSAALSRRRCWWELPCASELIH